MMMFLTGAPAQSGHGYCKTAKCNPGCERTPAIPGKVCAGSLGFGFSSHPSLPLLFYHKFFTKSLWLRVGVTLINIIRKSTRRYM